MLYDHTDRCPGCGHQGDLFDTWHTTFGGRRVCAACGAPRRGPRRPWGGAVVVPALDPADLANYFLG